MTQVLAMRDGQRAAACTAALVCLALIASPSSVRADAVLDATGRPVKASDASRVVSVGGAVTEILYALGLQRNIIAVDTTSLYPPDALRDKPNVGYMRQLSAEGVLGVAPTLILAIEAAGPKETIVVLQAARIPIALVPDDYSGEGIIQKIRVIAAATGVPSRGECAAATVRADLDALRRMETRIDKPKRVLFVLSFVNGRAMVSGSKTAADGIIRLAGALNAVTDYEGYKPIGDEAVIAAKPDVVLVMERGGTPNLTARDVFGHAAFAATPAASRRAFVSMEGLYLLGFGPRTARAARDLAAAVYPETKLEPLPSERETGSSRRCVE